MMEAKGLDKHVISLYVSNNPGVLIRIAMIFSRRGFNIDSLVVSEAHDPAFARMNIVASGDPETLDQIIKQLNKLVDVVHAEDLTERDVIVRELAMYKVRCVVDKRTEIMQIGHAFNCQIQGLTEKTIIFQAEGTTEDLDGLHSMLGKYGIMEMVRTGKVFMSRNETEST
jgi:acetolactate synthase-1/3 small subunit